MISRIPNSFLLSALVSLFTFLALGPGPQASAQQKSDSKRVKRPKFTKEDWQDVFFEDLFKEGLTGNRPAKVSKAESVESKAEVATNANAWSKIITRDSVENEVKALQQNLQKLGMSVSRFNTQFREIQQEFSLLAMMFAIIHEFDTDVRWKKYASTAQKIFAEAATKSRAPSKSAFEHAKQKKQDLLELVRGGTIKIIEDTENFQWPNVIDRTTIMVRLEKALSEVLKPDTSSESQFKKSKDRILQQAHMVAAMGKVVTLEDMDEADEEDYVQYADDMRIAAGELAVAVENSDFKLATKAVNRIEQSCNDCHGDWR